MQAKNPVKGQKGFQPISVKHLTHIGRVNEAVGKHVGLSYGTIGKIGFIEKKASQEDKKSLNDGDISVNEVYRTLQKEDRKQELLNSKPVMELPKNLQLFLRLVGKIHRQALILSDKCTG